jgi:hypothetical protein
MSTSSSCSCASVFAFVALTRRSISSLSMLTSPSASPLPSPADACPCSGSPGDPCSCCCGTRSPQLASDPAHRMQMDRLLGVSVMHAGQMNRPDTLGCSSRLGDESHKPIPQITLIFQGGRSCSRCKGIEEHLSSSSFVASWSMTFFDDTNHVCYLSDI